MKLTAAQSASLSAELSIELEQFTDNVRTFAEEYFLRNKALHRIEIRTAVQDSMSYGISRAVSVMNGYSVARAVRIAHDLLQDSNGHAEARALLAAADKSGCNPFKA